MSDLLSSSSFRTLMVLRLIVPLLYIHIKRANSLEMHLPTRKNTYLLVDHRPIDMSAENFSDIRNSVSQSLLKSLFLSYSKSILILLFLTQSYTQTHTVHSHPNTEKETSIKRPRIPAVSMISKC